MRKSENHSTFCVSMIFYSVMLMYPYSSVLQSSRVQSATLAGTTPSANEVVFIRKTRRGTNFTDLAPGRLDSCGCVSLPAPFVIARSSASAVCTWLLAGLLQRNRVAEMCSALRTEQWKPKTVINYFYSYIYIYIYIYIYETSV
jgi:hypothetical protein